MTYSFPTRRSSDLKQAMESLSANETAKGVRYHLPREEEWFKVAEHILENDKPDLMAVMFDGTDKIQHQAWPWLDKNLLPKNPQGHDKEMREVCRSEEHTSELQSLMRISYAVFCLKQQKSIHITYAYTHMTIH